MVHGIYPDSSQQPYAKLLLPGQIIVSCQDMEGIDYNCVVRNMADINPAEQYIAGPSTQDCVKCAFLPKIFRHLAWFPYAQNGL
ncbi:hypothetical protein FKM82_014699 [Ascaphus truei]